MPTEMVDISLARTEEQLQQVRTLFREYFAELALHLYYAHFENEVANLPGEYAPPAGCLLLASVSGHPAGCVGLRPFRSLEAACEMKRLYVRSSFRGEKIGRLLVERLIDEARGRGYHRMRLDTHPPTMESAVALYGRFGFVPVTDVQNPEPSLIYMELDLTARGLPG